MSASQDNNMEGEGGRRRERERERGRGSQLSKAVLEYSFRSKITHSVLGAKGRCTRNTKEKEARLEIVHFPISFPFAPPAFEYMSSFGKLSI